MGMLSD
jgi:hypothetical protein